jgi:hypothetical protein
VQEKQQTTTPNFYYNLVSILYHDLQKAQTCAAYKRDAQQSGQKDLEQFFEDACQNANREAERAQTFLDRLSISRTQSHTGYQGQYPSGMQSTGH